MIDIKVMKVNCNAIVPTKNHESDSGWDAYANEDVELFPGERTLVSLGVKVEIPEGYDIQVRARSGNAINKGLEIMNSPGTVDCDYRGELKAILRYAPSYKATEPITIERGQRIAQLVISKVLETRMTLVECISSTERGEKGCGSSGD